MIVCTSALDTIARQAFQKENVAISNMQVIMEQIALDPAISEAAKEAFLVSDADITRKNKQQFLDAVASKHPENIVVFVARRGKPEIQEGNGIDLVLVKPSPSQLAEAIFGKIESVTEKSDVNSLAAEKKVIEGFSPANLRKDSQQVTDVFGNDLGFGEQSEDEKPEGTVSKELETLDLPEFSVSEPEAEPVGVPEPTNSFIDRIKQCSEITELSVLTRELHASAVIKDLVQDNQVYTNLEANLRAINEKATAIITDVTIPTLEEKLDKIQALMYDKEVYQARTNSIIEQRVQEIINLLVTKTRECVTKRCQELDRAIIVRSREAAKPIDSARLAGLVEERSNILLELAAINSEVQSIFVAADDIAREVASNIAEENTIKTGSPLVDARLRLTGVNQVSANTVETITHILETADQSSEEFKAAMREIVVMNKKLLKAVDLDNEMIATLSKVYEALKANNVEDMVIKETFIKKSLRLFIAKEGTGRSVVPYICSKLKSRQNFNVLYVDITGNNKVKDYGDDMRSLDDWMEHRYEEPYCGVKGTISETPEAVQRFITALVKAADYYRVINVVVDPSQRAVIDLLAPDVLTINYVTDTSNQNIEFFKDFIRDTQYDNVAQRVIINKSVDSVCKPIVEKLGLIESLNVHLTNIPFVPDIVECGLRNVKPYEMFSVQEAFKEVCKVC